MDLIYDKKFKLFKNAFLTLETATEKANQGIVYRDSMVIRFLYTTELFWKMLKAYIYEEKNINCSYAVHVFRELRSMDFFSPEETEIALNIAKDRNFCAHTYQEWIVEKVAINIPEYNKFMRKILN